MIVQIILGIVDTTVAPAVNVLLFASERVIKILPVVIFLEGSKGSRIAQRKTKKIFSSVPT